LFLSGCFDRQHNHRWTDVTRLQHGSDSHTLYGLGAPTSSMSRRHTGTVYCAAIEDPAAAAAKPMKPGYGTERVSHLAELGALL
jgi:hypothetical protein